MGTAVAFFEKAFGKRHDIQTWLRICSILLLLLCLFSRTCMYLFPKDLWLDEGYIYEVISATGFPDLLQGHLSHQSAPILFVIIYKLLITYVGSDVAILYFLPFICSVISVIILFFLSYRIGGGGWLYVYFTMLIFSLCFTALLYSTEFKQYGIELLISCLILWNAIRNIDDLNNSYRVFSFKNIFFYCACILCSSTAVLFLAGILLAELIIFWRKNSFKSIKNINYLNIFILTIFILCYYLLYLKSSNSQHMQKYWHHVMIPLDLVEFLKYWPDMGVTIFKALFWGPPQFAVWIFSGLTGGSILLWCRKKEYLLLFSLPVLVTLTASAFFYPPGHGGVHGGRLLLFLLPNGVLVAAWFYAWVLSKLVAMASRTWWKHDVTWLRVARVTCIAVLSGLVCISALVNAKFLYNKTYYVSQISELVRTFHMNSTPESLNLVYAALKPTYSYYSDLSGRKPQVEIMPWGWKSVKARLEALPDHRRVLVLLSGSLARQAEAIFTSQGRTFFKIPAWQAMLFILPEMEGKCP